MLDSSLAKMALYFFVVAALIFALRRRHAVVVTPTHFAKRTSANAPEVPLAARARSAPKPRWVPEEVLRLKTASGCGCRKIAEMFNRRHADDGVTIGKSYVAKTIKQNAYRLLQMRRELRNRPPREFPRLQTLGVDLTEIVTADGVHACLLGAIDAGTRACLGFEQIKDLSTVAVLEALLKLIRRYGKPKTIKTDNGPQFTSLLFGFTLKCLGIRHLRSEPHMPWQNGRIERFFGTFKQAFRQITLPMAALPLALIEFRFFYNHVRTHFNLGGITPAEAWNGLTKSHNDPLWFEAWDGVLAGDYYPP